MRIQRESLRRHSSSSFLLSCFCILIFCSLCAAQSAPSVQKVEPPSWRAAHTINPVRLLVRGTNLQGARVSSANRELEPDAVVVNSSGTYLFVSVRINPLTPPGDYPLMLETSSGKSLIPFRVNQPLDPAKNFQG